MSVNFNDLTLEETWALIEQTLNGAPEPIQGMTISYTFDLSGDDGGQYGLIIKDGTVQVSVGMLADADCALRLSVRDFKKLLAGKLNSTASYMMGKLKVKGSLGLALKLESLLKEYTFE